MFVATGGQPRFTGSNARRYTGTLVGNEWKFMVNMSDNAYVTFGYRGLNIGPESVSFDATTMNEKIATGSLVGTLSTVDADDVVFTYTFDTSCAGTLDNSKFSIVGDQIKTNYYFQYNMQTSARVCIKSADPAGLFTTGVFTIDILPTALYMDAPTALTFTGTWRPAFSVQTLEQQFNDTTAKYFKIADGVGADPGYTTTLQLDGNLTSGSSVISASNVYFKSSSGTVDTIAGAVNPRVEIDSNALNYQSLDHATNFIIRDPASNSSVIGIYGMYIWLQVALPAEQPI